jgi:chromosome segregation ATPase
LNRPDDLKNARIADLEATVEVLREKLKRQHGVLRKAKEQKKNLLSENRELTIDRNNFRLKHHQVTVKSKELSDNLEKYNQKLKNRIDEMENEQKLCDQCLSEMNF